MSVSAQTVEETSNQQFATSVSPSPEQVSTEVKSFSPNSLGKTSAKSNLSVNSELVTPQNFVPVPGTTATSSAVLTREHPQSNAQYPQTNQKSSISSDVAQADIEFGAPNRGGSSYVGIAGNLGLGGDSALGDGNFMVISKVGLTDKLSVRPSLVLGDDTVILVPVTYDFAFEQVADPFSDPLPFAPYVGAGLALEAGGDSQLSFLISGGVDLPLSEKFTATAAVNAAFFNETDIGLSVGVGYNFDGL